MSFGIRELYFLIIVASAALFYGVSVNFDLILYDDTAYIDFLNEIHNLSFSAFVRKVSLSIVNANWHPLTVLSLYSDYLIYGKFSGGYHLTNVILHIFSTWILFNIFTRLKVPLMINALTVALFALHPVNVESILWVSERKGALAAFFSLLTIYFYIAYRQEHKSYQLRLSVFMFLLGLLSKATIVMLPIFFIILDMFDFFETRRFNVTKQRIWNSFNTHFPFLMASLSIGLITIFAHGGSDALPGLEELDIERRIHNFPVAFMNYFQHLFYDFNYSIYYPYKEKFTTTELIISYIFLLGYLASIIYFAKRNSMVSLCLLWFIVMLLPVSGLVQTGAHAYALRYMYLPAIGIFFLVASLIELLTKRIKKYHIVKLILVIVLLIGPLTKNILAWKDSVTLFEKSIHVVGDSVVAHAVLALHYSIRNNPQKTMHHYTMMSKAYVLRQGTIKHATYSSARTFMGYSDHVTAQWILNRGITKYPELANYYVLLAASHSLNNEYKEAEKIIKRGLEKHPKSQPLTFLLGYVNEKSGQQDLAIKLYKKAAGSQIHILTGYDFTDK